MKKYGVIMQLPEGNPMSAEHLLGKDFEAERWFETKAERETFLNVYQHEFVYFRRGDIATLTYTLVDK